MQLSQKSWESVSAEINRALEECGMSPRELATQAHLDYYAARRFLQRGVNNKTANTVKLCQFFAITLEKSPKVQTQLFEVLTGVLRDTWDGTEPHAELIAELIKSTKHFKIEDRKLSNAPANARS